MVYLQFTNRLLNLQCSVNIVHLDERTNFLPDESSD